MANKASTLRHCVKAKLVIPSKMLIGSIRTGGLGVKKWKIKKDAFRNVLT